MYTCTCTLYFTYIHMYTCTCTLYFTYIHMYTCTCFSSFRSAYLSCLKVLKLLLVAQGYSFILSVSQEIKSNSGR